MTRQSWIFVALGAVALTSLLASIAAWITLWRDRRGERLPPDDEVGSPTE